MGDQPDVSCRMNDCLEEEKLLGFHVMNEVQAEGTRWLSNLWEWHLGDDQKGENSWWNSKYTIFISFKHYILEKF